MNPMTTAPRGDDPVRLHMPNGDSFMAILVPVEGNEGPVWTWGSVDEFDPKVPGDWCDGVCWGSNSDGKPSTKPIGWTR